jgi:hypothetical protein
LNSGSPNENKISGGGRGASANQSGSVLIMGKVISRRVVVRCIVC